MLSVLVRGDGFVAVSPKDLECAAEAIRLLDRVPLLSLVGIASAAFLFLDWEEMVTVNECLARQSRRDPRHTRLPKMGGFGVNDAQNQESKVACDC